MLFTKSFVCYHPYSNNKKITPIANCFILSSFVNVTKIQGLVSRYQINVTSFVQRCRFDVKVLINNV